MRESSCMNVSYHCLLFDQVPHFLNPARFEQLPASNKRSSWMRLAIQNTGACSTEQLPKQQVMSFSLVPHMARPWICFPQQVMFVSPAHQGGHCLCFFTRPSKSGICLPSLVMLDRFNRHDPDMTPKGAHGGPFPIFVCPIEKNQ